MTDHVSGYFNRYMHICRLDDSEVDKIENGEVYVFPKVDGTNSSVWVEWNNETGEYDLCAGSRNHKLTQQWDNAGFYTYVLHQPRFKEFLVKHPQYILYSEWLVKHTIAYYDPSAWKRAYIFDVFDTSTMRFLHYEEYADVLIENGFDVIPPLKVIEYPVFDDNLISDLLLSNHYLMSEDKIGEGIVIKRYDFVNQYGRTTWAKVVNNVFKQNSRALFKGGDAPTVESQILDKYLTPEAMEHEYLKFIDEYELNPQNYAKFLGISYKGWLEDNVWNIIKFAKRNSVNFSDIQHGFEQRFKAQYPLGKL